MPSDRSFLVITAVGPDRPGLVHEIASAIHATGANLEDSRMAILGGEFATILLVSGARAALEDVRRRLPGLRESLGLECIAKDTGGPRVGDHLAYRIRVTGVDRPGIVHTISEILASRSINVASLESRIAHAPLSGTAMFVLDAELQIPSALGLATFRQELLRVGDEENLDVVLESAG